MTRWPPPRQDFRLLPLGVASIAGAWVGLRWPLGPNAAGVQAALAVSMMLGWLLLSRRTQHRGSGIHPVKNLWEHAQLFTQPSRRRAPLPSKSGGSHALGSGHEDASLVAARKSENGVADEPRVASLRRHVVLAAVSLYLLYLVTSLNVQAAHPATLTALAKEKVQVAIEGTVSSRVEQRVSPWGTPSCQADVRAHSIAMRGSAPEDQQPQKYGPDYQMVHGDLSDGTDNAGTFIRADPLVRIVGLPCDVLQGESINMHGKLAPREHTDRPAALVYASHVDVSGDPSASARIVATIERELTALIAARPDHIRGLLPGVALGDDGQIAAHLFAAMKLTQLTHLIAVSGGHISLAATIVLAIVGRRFPVACALATLAALGGLIILVGPEASVIRAIAMSLVVLAALARGRGTQAVAALSIALLAVAAINPWMAVSYGFLLSASATAGIVLLGTPLAEYLARSLPQLVAEAVAIPLAAQLACLPVLALFTDAGSIWGVLANALVAPVVAPLTICGLAVALACPAFPALAQLLLVPVQMCTWWIASVARTLAGWPGSGISLAWSGAFCLALGLVLIVVRRPIILAALLAALLLIGLWTMLPGTGRSIPKDWALVQCDVGQGSGLIARVPLTDPGRSVAASDTAPGNSDLTLMIDVGPEGDAAAACLRDAGVTHLDVLVLSHAHSDHIGGLPAVLAEVSVGQAWLSPNPDPAENSEWLHRQLAAHSIPFSEVLAGTTLSSDGTTLLRDGSGSTREPATTEMNDDGTLADAFATVLWPRVRDTSPGQANAQSIALHLSTGGGTVVLSDLTADSQERLARDTRVREQLAGARAVVVAHHGSADQSAALAKLLDPELALISVGHNSYGHPSERVLELYGGAAIFDTLTCGAIALDAEGNPSSGCPDK
ncbi:MAG: ComEC/Rec2 family competence protein [Ancrocorticia sp.]